MAVALITGGVARHKVRILVPIGIIEEAALTTLNHDRDGAVVVRSVFFDFLNNRLLGGETALRNVKDLSDFLAKEKHSN